MSWLIWLFFGIYLVLYSLGIGIFAYKTKAKKWWLYFFPIIGLLFVDKYTNGFKMMSIVVKHWMKTVIICIFVAMFAFLYSRWGLVHLTPKNSRCLTQMMYILLIICAFIVYIGNYKSAIAIFDMFSAGFKGEQLVCLLFIAVPFAIAFSKPKRDISQIEFLS